MQCTDYNVVLQDPPQPVLPIARCPFDPTWGVHNLGALDIQCSNCNALHWLAERLTKSSRLHPIFGMCCLSGKISLPPLDHPPPELLNLLTTQEPEGSSFRKHIRTYNNALAMTSVGCQIDHSINQDGRPAPYTFRLHGELIHRAGSLLPAEGQQPVYSQLYISDSQDALNFRLNNAWNTHLTQSTLQDLQDMLYRHHPGVRKYKQAFELTCAMPLAQQCRIALRFDPGCDRRRYQAPDASVREIAVILPGDGEQIRGSQDIILYRNHGQPLQRISDTHPFYPSLRYVLLFPTGQLGWYPNILYATIEDEGAPTELKHKHVSMAEFHHYGLFTHPTESNHVFLTCNLFQEFVCATWAVSEQNCQLAQIQSE